MMIPMDTRQITTKAREAINRGTFSSEKSMLFIPRKLNFQFDDSPDQKYPKTIMATAPSSKLFLSDQRTEGPRAGLCKEIKT
jgi:hypothetical protein